MTPVEALALVSAAAKAVKDLGSLLKSDPQAAPAIAEANQRIGELAAAQAELASTLAEKDARVRALDLEVAQLRDLGELVWRENVYWGTDGTGPFCPRCRHSDMPKRVPMRDQDGRWDCAVCEYVGWSEDAIRRQKEAEARRAARGRPDSWLDGR